VVVEQRALVRDSVPIQLLRTFQYQSVIKMDFGVCACGEARLRYNAPALLEKS
jgi:hypothetical protein